MTHCSAGQHSPSQLQPLVHFAAWIIPFSRGCQIEVQGQNFNILYILWHSICTEYLSNEKQNFPLLCPQSKFQRQKSTLSDLHPSTCIVEILIRHTGCPRRNEQYFGRVFLMLNYTDITQNTYIQSWTVTEIMAREKCGHLAFPRSVHYSCIASHPSQ